MGVDFFFLGHVESTIDGERKKIKAKKNILSFFLVTLVERNE